jgi:integrase
MIYLGKYGSNASRREYDRIIAEYVANNRRPLSDTDEVTIEQLIVRFLDYIDREINYSAGFRCRLQRVMRALHHLYGKQPVSQFTPASLKTLRQEFVGRGICRQTVNDYISNIRQLFYWGCEEELVSAEVAGALRMVKGLQTGRTAAPDYKEVKPINADLVEKTLALLPAPFQDMVKLQRLTSGRPQDVRNMRFCDIDRSGDVWRYVPFTHKTKKRGKTRELALGPRTQTILQPYFDNCEDDERFVFVTTKGNGWTNSHDGITSRNSVKCFFCHCAERTAKNR